MTSELKERMIRMLEEGKTDEEIIAALGISRRCFYNHVGKWMICVSVAFERATLHVYFKLNIF